MKLDKEKLKRVGREFVGASKEAIVMTAPVHVGAAVYHLGHPEVGAAIVATTLPWNAGRIGYYYVKGRREKRLLK